VRRGDADDCGRGCVAILLPLQRLPPHSRRPYAPEALYPARAVTVTGETISFALRRTPRVSCAKCGARLYADLPSFKMRGVNGTLLPGFKAEFHMHCREALAPVRDDLPHYAQKPAAFGGEDTRVDW
jgi:hypothetical protein